MAGCVNKQYEVICSMDKRTNINTNCVFFPDLHNVNMMLSYTTVVSYVFSDNNISINGFNGVLSMQPFTSNGIS